MRTVGGEGVREALGVVGALVELSQCSQLALTVELMEVAEIHPNVA